MADQFVAEIRIFPFSFAPTGWAMCNGQLLPISQNTALFSLLGTFYGGDGKSTFALPDLQGAAPMHQGQGSGLTDRVIGEAGGSDAVTVLAGEIPAHGHALLASPDPGELPSPGTDRSLARSQPFVYKTGSPAVDAMAPEALAPSGGGQPHNNLQPYLTLNFCIALQGIFPPRG
jgi:microcystin-dependent protein